MTVAEIRDYLNGFAPKDELTVEIYESVSHRYIDLTFDIAFQYEAQSPTLTIAIEAEKFT